MTAFIRNWTLPFAMAAGVLAYFLFASVSLPQGTRAAMLRTVAVLQPLLLFMMLLITFCKLEPREMRLAAWQPRLLLLQVAGFCLPVLLLFLMPPTPWRYVAESAMLCMICPTATAAAVVTRKLGGNVGTLMAYTIIINLTVALLVPAVVPILHPHPEQTFIHSFLLIISKVFPLLLGPFLLAVILRRHWPKAAEWLSGKRDLPFYLWAVSLSLAIAMSTRSIVHTDCPWLYLLAIAAVSLLTCILQFGFGRWTGRRHHDTITAGQACGQKNTVLIIWMGYTFMSPVTSIAGGFYSIWHNLYNSWQLMRNKEGG